jgi:hypothetical protein
VNACVLGVPALLHDLVVDAVAFGGPALHVRRAAPARGHPSGPVERDPGLEPSVSEVPAAPARFPDAFVRLVPVVAQPVDHAGDVEPAPVGGLHALGVGEVQGVKCLAVDVELELVRGAVADAHRPRTAPAFEMVEGLLW